MKDYTGEILIIDGKECRITNKLGAGEWYRIEYPDGTTDRITVDFIKNKLG